MKIIDLRFKSNLDENVAIKLNEIAREKIEDFHQFLSKISNDNKNVFEWWMSSPSSRYTLSSPLFFYFCIINYLDYLLKNDINVEEIIVDNYYLKKAFDSIISKNHKKIKVFSFETKIMKIKKTLRGIFSIFLQFIKKLLQILICKNKFFSSKNLKNKNLILIDKFIFPGYIKIDRYYNNLIDNVDHHQQERIFFVPALLHFNLFEVFSVYKKLNQSNINYLFKEEFINLFDIIDAFMFFRRKNRITLTENYICGYDISNIIKYELKDNMISYAAAIESILNIKFIKNIKKLNYKVQLSIDWFENQINDRGWNYGFNKFYPNIETIGYRGLIPSDLLLSEMYPTEDENLNGILPKKICVIGPALISEIKKYIKNIKIDIAPAFRFQHLWKYDYCPNNSSPIIFVALPINFDDSINILNIVIEFYKTIKIPNYKFIIKLHPTTSYTEIIKYLKYSMPTKFEIIEGNTEKILFKTNIMISGMSSICLESLAIGIPLLVVENSNRLNYRTIPKEISTNLYKFCKSAKDIINSINYFENLDSSTKNQNLLESNNIKLNYFHPVTKENVKKFLNL